MHGSSKPNHKAYALTHIYKSKGGDMKEIVNNYSNKDLVKLLSIRHIKNTIQSLFDIFDAPTIDSLKKIHDETNEDTDALANVCVLTAALCVLIFAASLPVLST